MGQLSSQGQGRALVPWWRRYWPLVLGLIAVLVVVAADRASKQRVGTDFHVFWQAGYDFAHGLPLYRPQPGARGFIYPPFAAQVFQVLGVFQLKTAAWLFYVASVLLIFVAIVISEEIVQRLEVSRRGGRFPLVLALLLSANFLFNNLNLLQVNLVIFVLCLLGARALAERREVAASGWIAAATAIKIVPIFFLVWAMIRGSRRTLAAVVGFGVLGVVLPMIQRGVSQGVVDLMAYYRSFLQAFAAGRVVTDYTNQSLAAMVYRAVAPTAPGAVSQYDYAYLGSLESAAPVLYPALALAILALFLIHLTRLRVLGQSVGPLEISSVFLVSHLLSAITWKAHLVTFLFVYYAFSSINLKSRSQRERVALLLAGAGAVVIGAGRDLIGTRLHHYVGGYSVIVWVMLLLFGLSVSLTQPPFNTKSSLPSQ